MILSAAAATAAADDGHEGRRRKKKKENKSDLSHKRIMEVGLVVFVALLLDSLAMMDPLLVKGELLCKPNGPVQKQEVRCEATGSNNSWCSVSSYKRDNCYFRFYECWIRHIPYNYNPSIINGQLFADIVISDLNETSWSVVIWTVDPEGWWFVDVKDSNEVSVFGLPGKISNTEPPTLFNASGCLGCPVPPIFEWYPDPKRHQFRFLVQNDTMRGLTPNTEVQFLLLCSNETNFTSSCGRRPPNPCAQVNSSVGKFIRVPDVYSTEFCMRFILPPINKNGVPREYYCGRTIDMTEYPEVPIHGEIPIPLWMKVISAVVMLLMVAIVIFLIGTAKGWITVPVRHRIRKKRPASSVTAACDSVIQPDVERKQELTSTIEERTQFLRTNHREHDNDNVLDAPEDFS